MRDNKVIGAAAGSVVLGSALAIGFCLTGGLGPQMDAAPFQAVGRVLAQQTIPLWKKGGQITVITRDTQTFQNPATDIQFASFRDELAKAGLKIDSVQALQIDPLRPARVPGGDFFLWIKKASKGSVIVSFMGPPVLSEAQIAQLGEIQPGIVAFCPGPTRDQVDLRSLFAGRLLHAAVVSKRIVKRSRPASEREIFDRQFVAVTLANLAALPAAP
jgi:hypothetical protein